MSDTSTQAHPLRVTAAAAVAAALVILIYTMFEPFTVSDDIARTALCSAVCVVCLVFSRSDRLARPSGVAGGVVATAIVVLTGAACAIVAWSSNPVDPGDALAVLPALALACSFTGIWEEVLFRFLVRDAFQLQMRDMRYGALLSAAASSILFALLHLGGAQDVVAPLRFVQAFSFALVMCSVASGRSGLALAVLGHAAYDVLCFLPHAALAFASQTGTVWDLPCSLYSQAAVDPQSVIVSTVVFVVLGAWSARRLCAEKG